MPRTVPLRCHRVWLPEVRLASSASASCSARRDGCGAAIADVQRRLLCCDDEPLHVPSTTAHPPLPLGLGHGLGLPRLSGGALRDLACAHPPRLLPSPRPGRGESLAPGLPRCPPLASVQTSTAPRISCDWFSLSFLRRVGEMSVASIQRLAAVWRTFSSRLDRVRAALITPRTPRGTLSRRSCL